MRFPATIVALAFICCTASVPDEAPAPTLAPHAHPLTGAATDYDPLIRAVGRSSVVLLGEATHGTHEFYVERTRITQRLIREKAFTALALEAEWIDVVRVDRYVRGESNDRSAVEALGDIKDFPRWMWRNREFADFVEWIREHNKTAELKVGVYGLDVYGLEESRAALPADVLKMPPRKRVAALEARRVGVRDRKLLDELFHAEQNARVVQNAEAYNRALSRGNTSSWNLRDRHMVVTIDRLQRYLLQRNGTGRIVVWAHNSHVGDARATSRARYGELNMAQLVREHWPEDASFTVGFMTHGGEVMAADLWDGPPSVQQLRPSLPKSHGAILHEVGLPRFLLILSEMEARVVTSARLQRAVGVIYRPMIEYESHYVTATLREQFDAVVHVDETKAVTPLD
jgi:erythromycin esterase-like protein